MTAESQWDTSYSALSVAPLRERRFVVESTVELLELAYRQAPGVLEWLNAIKRGLGRNNHVEFRRTLYERTELYRRLHGLTGELSALRESIGLAGDGLNSKLSSGPPGRLKNHPPGGLKKTRLKKDYTRRGYGTDKTRREKALHFDSTGGRWRSSPDDHCTYVSPGAVIELEQKEIREGEAATLTNGSPGGSARRENEFKWSQTVAEGCLRKKGSGITAGSTTSGNQEPTVEEIPTVPLAALP
ncbi:hypothetical protein C8F04DRAFT_1195164 [Mycena alexandri]|uniref:Uncharacterized protein n=1 Tax=Mycena alexandri TaxID=1745969 RepID=A0AAD6S6U3_9AGAR|nr:hypothetical protein C8F04DRAFT_1195164 [Mycena alexandri]